MSAAEILLGDGGNVPVIEDGVDEIGGDLEGGV